MPQLDPHFFASQIFWLALTFIPLFVILWKVALPRVAAVLAAREARIAADLDKAARLRDEAKAVLQHYEATLKEAHETARQHLKVTADAAAAESARRHAELAHTLAERIAAGEARIAAARDAALANVRSVAGEAAQAATERLIGVKVAGPALAQAVSDAAGEKR